MNERKPGEEGKKGSQKRSTRPVAAKGEVIPALRSEGYSRVEDGLTGGRPYQSRNTGRVRKEGRRRDPLMEERIRAAVAMTGTNRGAARVVGVDESTVRQVIKKDPGAMEEVRVGHQVQLIDRVYEGIQRIVDHMLDPKTIGAATLKDSAIAFGILSQNLTALQNSAIMAGALQRGGDIRAVRTTTTVEEELGFFGSEDEVVEGEIVNAE